MDCFIRTENHRGREKLERGSVGFRLSHLNSLELYHQHLIPFGGAQTFDAEEAYTVFIGGLHDLGLGRGWVGLPTGWPMVDNGLWMVANQLLFE